MNSRYRLLPLAILALASVSAALAQPLVRDVEWQFRRIAHHGDPLGWHLAEVADDPDVCRHYQGVVRKDGPDGTPYLLLTRSGNSTGFHCTWLGDCGSFDCPGELVVVEMGSRGKHGERLGSNKYTPILSMDDSPGDAADKAVTSIHFSNLDGWPSYHHPGGGQVVGNVFAIPLENPYAAQYETAIAFVDVFDPKQPALIKLVPIERDWEGFGVLGMTMDPETDEVLIFATSSKGSTRGALFTTTMELIRDPSAPDPLTLAGWWSVEDWVPPRSDTWSSWQTMNLIRQADGRLFLATGNETSTIGGGEDWIGLFELTSGANTGDRWTLEPRALRHLFSGEPQMGDLRAASGFHVSPMGVLMFYMGEHDNDGPQGTVKMGEFRSFWPELIASCGGWIEMYEDDGGWDDDSPDRSVMLDWVDDNADDWDDLDRFGFNDDIDSIVWNLPLGRAAIFYEHGGPPGEPCLVVAGAGVANQAYLDDDHCHGDHISAVEFEDVAAVRADEVRVCPSGCLASSVREGVLEVVTCPSGGDVYIAAGDYDEGYLRIGVGKGRSVRLHAENGTVRLSQ